MEKEFWRHKLQQMYKLYNIDKIGMETGDEIDVVIE